MRSDPACLGLCAQLDNEPAETLGVLADRLEDLGETELARAYRYLAKAKLCPLRYEDRWHWRLPLVWQQQSLPAVPATPRFSAKNLGHQLPAYATWALIQLPDRIGQKCNEAASRAEALALGARALVLGWELERRDREIQDREERQEAEAIQEDTPAEVYDELPF